MQRRTISRPRRASMSAPYLRRLRTPRSLPMTRRRRTTRWVNLCMRRARIIAVTARENRARCSYSSDILNYLIRPLIRRTRRKVPLLMSWNVRTSVVDLVARLSLRSSLPSFERERTRLSVIRSWASNTQWVWTSFVRRIRSAPLRRRTR